MKEAFSGCAIGHNKIVLVPFQRAKLPEKMLFL